MGLNTEPTTEDVEVIEGGGRVGMGIAYHLDHYYPLHYAHNIGKADQGS